MKKTEMLHANRLYEVLHYEPDTGNFFFRNKDGSKGRPVRSSGKGYVKIPIDGVYHYAHRLAWLYVNGKHPNKLIDHINGLKHDNSFSNLREATPQENAWNSSARKGSTSGCKGVRFSKRTGMWVASISENGQQKRIGSFHTREEAVEARESVAKNKYGIFHRKIGNQNESSDYFMETINSFCSAKSSFI